MNGSINIGTSGWHYEHWRDPFYPGSLSPEHFLTYYAQYFKTAEINNTFYHLPSEKAVAKWRDSTPTGFIFAVKASRYITHVKKLKEPEQSLRLFLKLIKILGDKLGPILFQLPPYWHFNLVRLKDFLEMLPDDLRYAFEFRDDSWINDSTINLLAEHNIAFCIYDFSGAQTPKIVTSDLIYIRLHGPEAAYMGQYDTETLEGWAKEFLAWKQQGKQIYCYFDNDEAGYAAKDALRLKLLTGS